MPSLQSVKILNRRQSHLLSALCLPRQNTLGSICQDLFEHFTQNTKVGKPAYHLPSPRRPKILLLLQCSIHAFITHWKNSKQNKQATATTEANATHTPAQAEAQQWLRKFLQTEFFFIHRCAIFYFRYSSKFRLVGVEITLILSHVTGLDVVKPLQPYICYKIVCKIRCILQLLHF